MTQENISYTANEIKAMVKTIESLRKTQKKYQDALEKVKGLLKDQEMALHAREKLANVFPELIEKEDEKIRKEIIDFLELPHPQFVGKRDFKKWIAWIEKQSKKKSADEVLKIRQELYQSGYNDGYKHGQEDITKSLSIGENINHTDIKEKAHQIAWETSKDYDPSLSKEAWCEMAALDMASWLKREVDDAYLQGVCDAKHEIEKQGKQKQTWKPNAGQLIVIKDLIEDKNTSKVNKVILRGMLKEIEDVCPHEIEKQGENKQEPVQKPFNYENATIHQKDFTPKDEPKFKVGNWISGYYTNYKVLSVNNAGYVVEDTDGDKLNILFENEKFHHLFTIADAKDGDVLLEEETGEPFIYNGNRAIYFSGYFLGAYCGIYNGKFNPYGNTHHWGENSCPATKEQRDLLFQKMKDAGYLWDSEKKKLKKIEPKTLNADKVIEWLKTHGNLVPVVTIKINEVIDKFKKDFEL